MTAASVHTVTEEHDLARIKLVLSGFEALTTGVQVIRKNTVTGVSALVRGARNIAIATPASDVVTLYDYEYPAGDAITYSYFQFPDTTEYSFGSAATYDVDDVWIKHVTRPYLSMPVEVVGYQPVTHLLRATAYQAVRSVLPIGAGDVRAGRTFGLSLRSTDDDARKAFDDLLKVGGVWYLHIPATNVVLPTATYCMAVDASENPVGRVHSGRRTFDVGLTEVQAPDADIAGSGITWTDVVATYADWTALNAAVASWDALLSVVADPAEVVV